MPAKAIAVSRGKDLELLVKDLAIRLGLKAEGPVSAGRRIWGAVRLIDVVLTDEKTRRKLGIECKAQTSAGSAEEKIPTTIQDIEAWPIPGIVVITGEGFSKNMTGYMLSTGKVVHFDDLADWLRLFFSL